MKYRIIVKVNDEGKVYYCAEMKSFICWYRVPRSFKSTLNNHDIKSVTDHILNDFKVRRKRSLIEGCHPIAINLVPMRFDKRPKVDPDKVRTIENIDFAPITIEY
jgi:hypothetical protein